MQCAISRSLNLAATCIKNTPPPVGARTYVSVVRGSDQGKDDVDNKHMNVVTCREQQ